MSRQVRDRDKYESGSKWFCDWHRAQPFDNAKMIDLDGCGYCHICMYPLYLVEATEERGRKTATVTENLGELAGLEVFVFYRDSEARPGQFLVDHRNASTNHGWVAESHAWDLLTSVRRSHYCHNSASPIVLAHTRIRDLQEQVSSLEAQNHALKLEIFALGREGRSA